MANARAQRTGVEGFEALAEPTRRVAPGQAVVLYAPGPGEGPEVEPGGEVVLGGGTAA